jgi:hypothetical protein
MEIKKVNLQEFLESSIFSYTNEKFQQNSKKMFDETVHFNLILSQNEEKGFSFKPHIF